MGNTYPAYLNLSQIRGVSSVSTRAVSQIRPHCIRHTHSLRARYTIHTSTSICPSEGDVDVRLYAWLGLPSCTDRSSDLVCGRVCGRRFGGVSLERNLSTCTSEDAGDEVSVHGTRTRAEGVCVASAHWPRQPATSAGNDVSLLPYLAPYLVRIWTWGRYARIYTHLEASTHASPI